MKTIHELKTWPEFFEAVDNGTKTFEVRKDDRNFKVGDMLCLREWVPDALLFTGRFHYHRVTYVLRGGQFGVEAGHVVMGLGDLTPELVGMAVQHRKALFRADVSPRPL